MAGCHTLYHLSLNSSESLKRTIIRAYLLVEAALLQQLPIGSAIGLDRVSDVSDFR